MAKADKGNVSTTIRDMLKSGKTKEQVIDHLVKKLGMDQKRAGQRVRKIVRDELSDGKKKAAKKAPAKKAAAKKAPAKKKEKAPAKKAATKKSAPAKKAPAKKKTKSEDDDLDNF